MKNTSRNMTDILPTMDDINNRWQLKIGAARILWDQISESELLASQGHKSRLVELVQEKHAMTRDDANKEVNRFFEKHMSWRR